MKQHITVEQLKELPLKSKQKLQTWWDINYKEETIILYEMQDGFDPILSIGQMIEFLDEHNEYEDWWEDLFYPSGKDVLPKYDGELCDALWEAVKEVL